MNKKNLLVSVSILIINIIVIIIAFMLLNRSIQDAKSEISELIKSEVKAESLKIEREKTNKFKESLFPIYDDMGLKYNKEAQTVIDTLAPLLDVLTNIESSPDEKTEENE